MAHQNFAEYRKHKLKTVKENEKLWFLFITFSDNVTSNRVTTDITT